MARILYNKFTVRTSVDESLIDQMGDDADDFFDQLREEVEQFVKAKVGGAVEIDKTYFKGRRTIPLDAFAPLHRTNDQRCRYCWWPLTKLSSTPTTDLAIGKQYYMGKSTNSVYLHHPHSGTWYQKQFRISDREWTTDSKVAYEANKTRENT
jgi:hypothetical protein